MKLRDVEADVFALTPVLRGPAPYYMGIDPGLTGAIALVNGKSEVVIVDIPTMTRTRSGKTKTGAPKTESVFDYAALVDILVPLRLVDESELHITLEEAQIMVKGKASSAVFTAFKVGIGFGLWPMYFYTERLPFATVHPSKWKRAMGLWGKDKDDARIMAQKKFANARPFLQRKGDHNRAEALLLCEYARSHV